MVYDPALGYDPDLPGISGVSPSTGPIGASPPAGTPSQGTQQPPPPPPPPPGSGGMGQFPIGGTSAGPGTTVFGGDSAPAAPAAPAQPASPTGTTGDPAAPGSQPAGTGAEDTFDYYTGMDASGQRIDPGALADITDPGQISYYANDPTGMQKGYQRELFRRYGALNNLGDPFRNYLIGQAGRVLSGWQLAQALPESSPYHQEDFLRYLDSGLGNGSVWNPQAYRAAMSELLNYADQAANGGPALSPALAGLLSGATDQDRETLYNWGLLGYTASNPLYAYAQPSGTRNRLYNQMPGGTRWADWVRRIFGVGSQAANGWPPMYGR